MKTQGSYALADSNLAQQNPHQQNINSK